jgi:aminoglycoside phosphotransferase family enzyme/predicted kinase
MDLTDLIAALSDPAAYPGPAEDVEVRQTHISVVFLAGPHVYKVKKPVALGFLDYSTLEQRRHFCEQEVRLNRRLAPTVYLGVVPITQNPAGTPSASALALRVEGDGPVVEWAVKMERLPDEARLREQYQRGAIGVGELSVLARRIAAFHAQAESGPAISACGRFAVVAANARENFAEVAAAGQVGQALSVTVFKRLQSLTEHTLSAVCPLVEARAARGVPRDGHGDLRLDHVYWFPDRPPPADLVVIDGIEFNERFRYADPVADLAFLVMDLMFHGGTDLALALAEVYFQAAGDPEGRALLPFYTSYRAAVRGKVEALKRTEPEVPPAERATALTRARAHWLLALGLLEDAGRRPCLILVGGLPGAGKSTLSRGLAANAGFTVVRSDVVRKDLAADADINDNDNVNVDDTVAESASEHERGLYTPEWTERTYAECLRQAEALLFEGRRVLVDANFRREADRRRFLDAAARWCVPARLLLCQAGPEVVQSRLQQRRDDASDADWSIYLYAAASWEELGPLTRPATATIDTGQSSEQGLSRALDALREIGLIDAPRTTAGRVGSGPAEDA